MSFPTIKAPVLSPSLNEYDLPTFADDQGNILPIFAVVQPDADGVTSLDSDNVTAERVSQVTGKRQAPQVGAHSVPVMALMQVNASTGALEPFKAASATSATLAAQATKLNGKFQSGIRTATGSAESIAHGLGVTPTLVLLSIYDTNGVSLPIAMSEGSHTSTNVVVTVTASVKYKVIALV